MRRRAGRLTGAAQRAAVRSPRSDRGMAEGARIVEVIVEHVGPPAQAGGGAVDEHHRDAAEPEGLREGQAIGQLPPEEISAEEPRRSHRHVGAWLRVQRQRCRRLHLQGDFAGIDDDRALIGVAVNVERRFQDRLPHLTAGIVDAKQRGHCRPGVGPEVIRCGSIRVSDDGHRSERCPIPAPRCRARRPRTRSSATGTNSTRMRSRPDLSGSGRSDPSDAGRSG